MPRPRRVDYENAWHHVMNRGASRQSIFRSDDDRILFLDCLVEATISSNIEIHGYCLMGNHFHLLVRSQSGRLSEFLRLLSGRYTRKFNMRQARDGPLFRGRATSVLISSDAQLVLTSRYIHLNPVVAGLCRTAHEWAWSSARVYLNHDASPPWLYTRSILEMFTSSVSGGDYHSYLNDGVDAATAEFYTTLGDRV